MIHHNKNNLCLPNLEIEITKINLHIKSIALFVTEQISPSPLVSRSNETTKTKEKLMLDQKSFVQNFRSPANDKAKRYDTRYRSKSTSRNNFDKNCKSQNRYRSTSRGRISYDKSTTPPQYTRLRYDKYKETRDLTALLIDHHTSHHIDVKSSYSHRYRSRLYSRNNNFTRYTSPLDHLLDQETVGFLNLAHIQIKEINLIQSNHKLKLIQLISKYNCTTQPKWQTR